MALVIVLGIFVVYPALTFLLIVNAKKKKPVKPILKWYGITFGILVFALIVGVIAMPDTDEVSTDEPTTMQVGTQEPTTKEKVTNPPTTTVLQDTMIEQFKLLGFSQTEAEEMKEIFTTVGIDKISNIQYGAGSGIDNLQAFVCDIYDYQRDKGGVSVHFTIDKRQLCFISLDGIPATKADYAYINIFGNVKVKTSNSTRSVTLYDKWDENGEIDKNSIGYKVVFDYENKKLENYKQ